MLLSHMGRGMLLRRRLWWVISCGLVCRLDASRYLNEYEKLCTKLTLVRTNIEAEKTPIASVKW